MLMSDQLDWVVQFLAAGGEYVAHLAVGCARHGQKQAESDVDHAWQRAVVMKKHRTDRPDRRCHRLERSPGRGDLLHARPYRAGLLIAFPTTNP